MTILRHVVLMRRRRLQEIYRWAGRCSPENPPDSAAHLANSGSGKVRGKLPAPGSGTSSSTSLSGPTTRPDKTCPGRRDGERAGAATGAGRGRVRTLLPAVVPIAIPPARLRDGTGDEDMAVSSTAERAAYNRLNRVRPPDRRPCARTSAGQMSRLLSGMPRVRIAPCAPN